MTATANNQDRLLSDEELLTEVLSGSVYDYLPEEYKTKSAIPSELCDEAFGKLKKHRFDLINTQKRLYAESVIGKHHATYNNDMGINDASAGAISIAVNDTVRAIKANPSNENQIRCTKWLTEEVIKYVNKGIAAKAKYDLIAEQKARIK